MPPADLATLLARADARSLPGIAGAMQATMGNASLQRLIVQAQAVAVAKHRPKAKAKPRVVPKPKPPPAPSFTLFGVRFKVVGGAVRPAGKGGAHGWTFTASGAGAFDAERVMPHATWTPSGGSATDIVERTSITVSGTSATVATVEAQPTGTTMTIPLDAHEHPTLKSIPVGASAADALDLPAAALAGLSPGDRLKLTAGGRSQVFVFSSLIPDGAPPVSALFFIGQETKIQGGIGIEGADVAPFAATFAALQSAGKLTADEATSQAIFDFLSEIEGGFGTVQTADTGVLSFGFAQWTAMSDLPPMLSRIPAATFARLFGRYGLAVATPVLGTPNSIRQFVPTGRDRLSARNPSEHCLTLNGVELVSQRLFTAAGTWSAKLTTAQANATTAKAEWLAATTAPKKKAALKKIQAIWKQLAGLPSVPSTVPKALAKHPDQMADRLIAAAGTGLAKATAVAAGTASVEAIRTDEWALRFQMAGKDQDVQAAEVHQAQDSFTSTLAQTTDGIPNSRLMQTDRAHAALFSSFINAGPRALRGIAQAVTDFRAQKVADPATKADWDKFPWPAADPKWTATFDPVSDDFETLAETKLLAFTFDPVRRKKLLDKHFPP